MVVVTDMSATYVIASEWQRAKDEMLHVVLNETLAASVPDV